MDMLKEKINSPETKKTFNKALKAVAIGFLAILVVDFATFVICFKNNLGPFNKDNDHYEVQETVK